MLESAWQACALFFVPLFGMGSQCSMYQLGYPIYTACVFAINGHQALATFHWTWINHVVMWGSNILFLLWSTAYTFVPGQEDTSVFLEIVTEAPFWASAILAATVALLPRFFACVLSLMLRPRPTDTIRVRLQQLEQSQRQQRRRTRRDGAAGQSLLGTGSGSSRGGSGGSGRRRGAHGSANVSSSSNGGGEDHSCGIPTHIAVLHTGLFEDRKDAPVRSPSLTAAAGGGGGENDGGDSGGYGAIVTTDGGNGDGGASARGGMIGVDGLASDSHLFEVPVTPRPAQSDERQRFSRFASAVPSQPRIAEV